MAAENIVVFDLETNGRGWSSPYHCDRPEDEEILEIGAESVTTGEVFHQYLLPNNQPTKKASSKNGFRKNGKNLMRHGEIMPAVARGTGLANFMEFLNSLPGPVNLAGYNSHKFDNQVLHQNLKLEGLKLSRDGNVVKCTDVMKITKTFLAGQGHRKYNLGFAVQTILKRGQAESHAAKSDVRDTVDLLRHIGLREDTKNTIGIDIVEAN